MAIEFRHNTVYSLTPSARGSGLKGDVTPVADQVPFITGGTHMRCLKAIQNAGACLVLTLLTCGCWTPYQLPSDFSGPTTFTNRSEAVEALNSFAYVSTVDGDRPDLIAFKGIVASKPGVFGPGTQFVSREKTNLTYRMEFLEDGIVYHQWKLSRHESIPGLTVYEPDAYKFTYGDIREIWITAKPHKRLTKGGPEGCYVIVFVHRALLKYSVLVSANGFRDYLRALLTLFPHAKIYSYDPPLRGPRVGLSE